MSGKLGMHRRKPAVGVKEMGDRGIRMERKLAPFRKYKYHTVHIPENESEPPYVDVCMSGTVPVKDEKTGIIEQVPVGPYRLWIKRGMDVANVPTWAVHILVETAIEVRYRQKIIITTKGDKKNAFIPYTRKSYPCSIIESYNEKREVVDESAISDQDPYDEAGDGSPEDMAAE